MKIRAALVVVALLLAGSASAAPLSLSTAQIKTQAAHTIPPAGWLSLWAKTSNLHLYVTNSSGTDIDISAGGGGGGSVSVTSPLAGDGTGGDPLTCTLCVTTTGTQSLINKTMSGASNTFSAIPQASVTNLTSDLAALVPTSRTVSTSSPLGGGGALSGNLTLTCTGCAVTSTANTWTASQNVAAVALTDGASIATNAALGNTFTVTLGGNRTLANPTNLVSGGDYSWIITQDGTGSRTLSYGAAFTWGGGGSAPTLLTAAAAIDVISCKYNGTVLICGSVGPASGGGSSYYQTIADEATPLTQRATLDFAGAGVSCADSGGTKTVCTIASGGGTTQTIDVINATAATGKTLTAAVANSGANVGFILDNSTTLGGTTLLLSLRNNTSEKFYVDNAGNVGARSIYNTGLSYGVKLLNGYVEITGGNIAGDTNGSRNSGAASLQWGQNWSLLYGTTKGANIASAGTIAPVATITHITGSAAISTITIPVASFVGCLKLVPDGAFTLATGGNIALASTAVVNRTLEVCYDGTSWTPSY